MSWEVSLDLLLSLVSIVRGGCETRNGNAGRVSRSKALDALTSYLLLTAQSGLSTGDTSDIGLHNRGTSHSQGWAKAHPLFPAQPPRFLDIYPTDRLIDATPHRPLYQATLTSRGAIVFDC